AADEVDLIERGGKADQRFVEHAFDEDRSVMQGIEARVPAAVAEPSPADASSRTVAAGIASAFAARPVAAGSLAAGSRWAVAAGSRWAVAAGALAAGSRWAVAAGALAAGSRWAVA